AQQNAPVEQTSQAQSNASQSIAVELTKTLDARKLTAGDPVSARITQAVQASDGTVVPPGSMVKGHITAATTRAKGAPQSSIAMVFDNSVLKNGNQLPLQATIQAVGAPPMITPEQYGVGGGLPTMNNPGSPNPPGTLSPSGPMGGGAPVG